MRNEVEPKCFILVPEARLEKQHPSSFTRFKADWRNLALLVVTAFAVSLLVMRFTAHAGRDQVIALVDGKPITEEELFLKFKHEQGVQQLMTMISDEAIQEYAAQQQVTVSESEIDQFLNFERAQFAMRGQTLDQFLQAHGQNLSLSDFRRMLRATLLTVKLVVPDDDINVELAKPSALYDLPERYQFHDFCYLTKAAADNALVSLKQSGGVQEAANTSTDPKAAMAVLTKSARDLGEEESGALQQLKPYEFSAPIEDVALTSGASDANGVKSPSSTTQRYFHVLQLLAVLPVEQATFANRSGVVGQHLLSVDQQKYAQKIAEVKATALQSVHVKIISDDYQSTPPVKRCPSTPILIGQHQWAV